MFLLKDHKFFYFQDLNQKKIEPFKCNNNEETEKIEFIYFKQIPDVCFNEKTNKFTLFAIDSDLNCYFLQFRPDAEKKIINLKIIWKSVKFKNYEDHLSKINESGKFILSFRSKLSKKNRG